MSYSDILGATKLYGGLLNQNFANTANNLTNVKMDYAPVNPYSSGAYSPRSARNIYTGTGRDVQNPVALYGKDSGLSTGDKALLAGSQGLQYMKMANTMQPFAQNIATGLGAKGTMGSFGPAAFLYGATRNQNHYDWTRTESLGTIGSTAMAAHSLAPVLNPILSRAMPLAATAASSAIPFAASAAPAYGAGLIGPAAATTGMSTIAGMHPALLIGGLLLGGLFSKKGKNKAKRMREKAYKDIETQQKDIYTKREKEVEESREDLASQWMAQQYKTRQDQYDNQYGGHYIDRSYADEGMKIEGDIVAEFTGNELVVNEQDKVEKALAEKNYPKVASYIKKAMDGGQITPGPETHKGNPMPVDSEGNIYAGGGTLPFKAIKGSGIYDHATDQFKPGMTDKEIAMVVKKNIAKWKSNGMA